METEAPAAPEEGVDTPDIDPEPELAEAEEEEEDQDA